MFSSYNFDNLTGINDDECYLDQRSIQNTNQCNYHLQNYFANDCTMKTPIDLATSQPGIIYKGGHSMASGGCNVDDSSKLIIKTINDNPVQKIDLFHRPFATVPYLGRGSVNPDVEFEMKVGDKYIYSKRKTSTKLGEENVINYQHAPLLRQVLAEVSNPGTQIEALSDSNWIRGGLASRELNRDTQITSTSNK